MPSKIPIGIFFTCLNCEIILPIYICKNVHYRIILVLKIHIYYFSLSYEDVDKISNKKFLKWGTQKALSMLKRWK